MPPLSSFSCVSCFGREGAGRAIGALRAGGDLSNSWDARRRHRSVDPAVRGIDRDLRMTGDRTGGGARGRRLVAGRVFWARLTASAAAFATVSALAAASAAYTKSEASTSAAAGVANSGECIAGCWAEVAADETAQLRGLIVMVAVECAAGCSPSSVLLPPLSPLHFGWLPEEGGLVVAWNTGRSVGGVVVRGHGSGVGNCMANGEALGGAAAAAAAQVACRLATVRVLMPVGVAWKAVSSPTADSGSGGCRRGDSSAGVPPVPLMGWLMGSALQARRLLEWSATTLQEEAAATGSSALYAARATFCTHSTQVV